jgi:transcriptional regulator with XRE-family HTH domain
MARPRANIPLVIELAQLRAQGTYGYEVAADAGIPPNRLSEFARGQRQPAPEVAARIADAIGKPVEQFWPDLAT